MRHLFIAFGLSLVMSMLAVCQTHTALPSCGKADRREER